MQTILVVEDELLIAEIAVDILESEGYRTVVASNGQEALTRLEKLRPDLILSDVMMPVMDGRELCKRLQAHPEQSSIPLVLMSAAYSPALLDDCKYRAFLRKPFDFTELVSAVTTVLAEPSSGQQPGD